MPSTYPFYFVAAFSKGPFQGNPAAVVFIDQTLETDTETLKQIAVNFNQPITSFVGPQIASESGDETVAAFRIRWFSASQQEVPLCGHGTMAAARAVFERGLVAPSVEVIEFHTQTAGVMRARRVQTNCIEIRLPAGAVTDVPAAEQPKIAAALAKAFGRDVAIKYLGAGSGRFKSYLLVELDDHENLGESKVIVDAFLHTGYVTNVITTAASGDAQFVSRMFAPAMLPPPFSEDAVCGSAHCLLAPYWSTKKGLVANQPFTAKQVSSRSGELGLVWNRDTGLVALKGQTFVIATGEIFV
ncbi:hypothetical protein C8R43DRAFT_165755 [Mycena crocata]|nr:hypothetical protein C8R43DRAFT_165755 [Mycena crocata]